MSARALPLLWILLLAGVARGEEEAPAYGVMDLAFDADSVPAGWALVEEDEVEGTPAGSLEEQVAAALRGAGIEEALGVETRLLRKADGQVLAFTLVEVDGSPALQETLEKEGAARGWAVAAIGHPLRVLVVAGPKGLHAEAIALQRAHAVRALSQVAVERLWGGSRVGAVGYAKGALAIDPSAGRAHAALGVAVRREGADGAERAVEHIRKAFAKGATHPPEGRLALFSHGRLGQLLLAKKQKELDREGRDHLRAAVALAEHAEPRDPVYEWLYDLACAQNRVGETEEVFGPLGRSFELAKQLLQAKDFRDFVEHALKDEDLESVRGDARFQELIDKTGLRTASEGI